MHGAQPGASEPSTGPSRRDSNCRCSGIQPLRNRSGTALQDPGGAPSSSKNPQRRAGVLSVVHECHDLTLQPAGDRIPAPWR